jgi:hypothetical protein
VPSCGLTAFGKFFECVRPYRLEQAPATGGCRSIQCYQRFRDKTRYAARDTRCGTVSVTNDESRRLQRAPTREDSQMAQRPLLPTGQQLIAPVERCMQRLVPRRRRPSAAGQQSEPVI